MLQWPQSTLYEAIESIAGDQPDAPAVYAGSEEWTYDRLLTETRALAGGLADLGVGAGDMVAVWLGNRPEWIAAQLAASALGAAVVAVNTRYRTEELAYMLSDSGCKAMLTETSLLGRKYLEMLAELAPDLETTPPDRFDPERFGHLEHIVALDGSDYTAVRDYRGLADRAPDRSELDPASDPESPACVFYTSGTTSAPKGCPQTNRSVLNHSYEVGAYLGVSDGDVALGALPFCGVMGYNVMLSALTHGVPLVAQTHFDPERAIELVEAHDVTYFSGIESMFLRMLDADGFEESRVESVERGAVPFINGMDETAFERIESGFGFPVVQVYGLSEGNSQIFIGDPADPIELRKRVGGPMIQPDEEEAKIVDPETGERVPPGEKGELCLRGYNVIDGYLDKPDETAAAFDDEGWFHTGDLCVRDPDRESYLYYQSRLDDALRVRGFLVSPGDIERAIDGHPDVELAEVVGAPHPRHGQVPVAFVKRTPDGDVSEAELAAFLDDRVADFKVPEAFHFVDEFPRTEGPHGEKIQKGRLRERVAADFEDGTS